MIMRIKNNFCHRLSTFLVQGFCDKGDKYAESSGTQYNQWVLARAANHNHNIEHLRRKYNKDRYSIHKLTNLSFMIDLVILKHRYHLNLNQKILLIAQMNHVIQVTGKDRSIFFQLSLLQKDITETMQNPDDLICLGTFCCTLASMSSFHEQSWQYIVDNILAEKFDEEYDELFGIIIGLNKYRMNLLDVNDFLKISKDKVIPSIPIIYRNSLEVLRQYITYNIFNIKECKMIFEALYYAKINEKFFWTSVRDWFNIYTKQQLTKKQFDQFFIMKESAVDKILHDHGIIRPRPILHQLITIVYILSQNGFFSYRFLEFAQDLIIYTIDNGSKLYKKYKKLEQQQQLGRSDQPTKVQINQQIRLYNQKQQESVKNMQKKYKTIFVNPIDIRDQNVIYFLVILAKFQAQSQNKQEKNRISFYDKDTDVYIDSRVVNWLLMQLVKPEMRYTVHELLMIVECQKFLKQRSQINIQQLILHKLENPRHMTTSFDQVKKLMEIIPLIKLNKLNTLLINFLKRNHPSEILKLVKLIQEQKRIPYLIQFILNLPEAVNRHDKYYSFEQNCYFLYLLLEYSECWGFQNYNGDPSLMIHFESQMQELKEQIKIVTYNRGFKLTVNSYFHKIMEKIDVVDFFQGGRG